MGIFSRKKRADKSKEKPKKDEAEDLDLKTSKSADKEIRKQKGMKKGVKAELKKFEGVDRVLVKPLVTEKSSNFGMDNQYAFEVNTGANKIEIRKAIETYYKVRPVKVNVINVRGKNVRWGRARGMTKSWRKAVVTLHPGDKIEVYEGV